MKSSLTETTTGPTRKCSRCYGVRPLVPDFVAADGETIARTCVRCRDQVHSFTRSALRLRSAFRALIVSAA